MKLNVIEALKGRYGKNNKVSYSLLEYLGKRVKLTYGDLETEMSLGELKRLMIHHGLSYDNTLSVLFSEDTWLEIGIEEVNNG